MYFPPVNPVDDGFFVYVFGCLLTGILGSYETWTAEYTLFGEKMRLSHILVIGMNIVMPLCALIAFKSIYQKFDREHL